MTQFDKNSESMQERRIKSYGNEISYTGNRAIRKFEAVYKLTMITPIEAAKYEEIEMVVYTGNLEDGVQLALQHMDEGFDILISRGGTAELIRRVATIPVIEITLNINDILRAILLVGNLTEAYAVVGYPTVTQPARVLCEMMNYRMNIVTIHSPEELGPVLRELKAGGCNFILCDVITEMMAREAGMEPILILSGPESIDIAIEYSVNMCRAVAETKARSRLFTKALDMQGMKTVIMKRDGTILFSTYNEKNITAVTGHLKKLMESCSFIQGWLMTGISHDRKRPLFHHGGGGRFPG